jgi:hypothetical protein
MSSGRPSLKLVVWLLDVQVTGVEDRTARWFSVRLKL